MSLSLSLSLSVVQSVCVEKMKIRQNVCVCVYDDDECARVFLLYIFGERKFERYKNKKTDKRKREEIERVRVRE